MQDNLVSANIKKRSVNGCGCQSTAFVYTLPCGLGLEILPYLKKLGTPAVSFEKTSLLKLENADYVITGIKRLKDVRFTLKNSEKTNFIDIFEEILIKYIKNLPV